MSTIPKILLFIETSTVYGRGLLRGISHYSTLHGPWSFYREAPFYRETSGRRRTLGWLKRWGPDGIIMRERTGITEELLSWGVPTIIAPHSKGIIEGVPNLVADDKAIGRLGAEHLLECGFRNFAYCGFNDFFWSRLRGEYFRDRLAEASFSTFFYQEPPSKIEKLWEREPLHIAGWLKSLPKPIGLMACNDDCGLQVIEACKLAGLHVPDDVAILGVDNDDLICKLSEPQLSSVVINGDKAGYEAAELLCKMMTGQKPEQKLVIVPSPYIFTRQSTDILAIQDPDVAEALRFIRQEVRRVIQVEDVAAAVAMSRRSLERRFRQVIGRSVLKEIRRVRIEQIIRMLLDTNLTISQIATAQGYTDTDHISRYFRLGTGMTLLAYRRKFGLQS